MPAGSNIVGWIGLQCDSDRSLLAGDRFLEERIREVEGKRAIRKFVNMDSDSKNLITLGEGKFGQVTLVLPFIEKCLLC